MLNNLDWPEIRTSFPIPCPAGSLKVECHFSIVFSWQKKTSALTQRFVTRWGWRLAELAYIKDSRTIKLVWRIFRERSTAKFRMTV